MVRYERLNLAQSRCYLWWGTTALRGPRRRSLKSRYRTAPLTPERRPACFPMGQDRVALHWLE